MATSPMVLRGDSSNVHDDQPFRLFDLPQEIQDKIYCEYYGPYDLELTESDQRSSNNLPTVRGLPAYASLERTCRKVREDASKCRKQCYSGTLRITEEKYTYKRRLRRLRYFGPTSWWAASTTRVQLSDISLHNVSLIAWEELLKIGPSVTNLELTTRDWGRAVMMPFICWGHFEALQSLNSNIEASCAQEIAAYQNGEKDREWLERASSNGLDVLGRFTCGLNRVCPVRWNCITFIKSGLNMFREVASLCSRQAIHSADRTQKIIFENRNGAWKVVSREMKETKPAW